MTGVPLTILVVSDREFLPRLKALASSIQRNAPSTRLHAYLVNLQPDDRDVEELRRLHSGITTTFVHEALDDARVTIALDGMTQFTEKAGFCVNLRGRAIFDLLQAGVPITLYLDADSIVRGDLSELVQMIQDNDIVIHKRDHLEEFRRVAGGAIGVNNTAAARAFVRRFIERIDALGNRTFFSDQWSFHLTALEFGNRVRIAHLPLSYIDWEFSDDSHIWSGKGQRKLHDSKYLAEERHYSKDQ